MRLAVFLHSGYHHTRLFTLLNTIDRIFTEMDVSTVRLTDIPPPIERRVKICTFHLFPFLNRIPLVELRTFSVFPSSSINATYSTVALLTSNISEFRLNGTLYLK